MQCNHSKLQMYWWKWCWLPRVHFSRRSSKIKNSHQIQSPLEYSGWRMYVSQEAMVNFINFSTLDTLLWIFHLFPELLKFISATTFHVEKLSTLCHVGFNNEPRYNAEMIKMLPIIRGSKIVNIYWCVNELWRYRYIGENFMELREGKTFLKLPKQKEWRCCPMWIE